MFISIPDDFKTKLASYLLSLKNQTRTDSALEFEIRFGSFVYNKEIKRSNFYANNNIDTFFALKRSLLQQNIPVKETFTTEYIYNYDDSRGNVKRIVDANGNESFMTKKNLSKYDVYDYDARLSLSIEREIAAAPAQQFKQSFVRQKKRYTFVVQQGQIDMTIVHSGTEVTYEIEIEVGKDATVENIIQLITMILQTRQTNFYVITNNEKRHVLNQYKALFNTYSFVGAQPETLHKNQLTNLYKELYSVTDKADGERVFMFIDSSKKIYFIDNNLSKIYKTNLEHPHYYTTVIDGELVTIDGKIHFLAFDLVAYNGEDIRGNSNYTLKPRLNRLNHIISTLKQVGDSPYVISMKKYYMNNVFLGSEVILSTVSEKQYKNDGLIFTPVNQSYPRTKKWPGLLKWKPAELNTIDLYSVKREGNSWDLYVQHVDKEKMEGHNKPRLELFDVNKLCNNENRDFTTFRTTFDQSNLDPTTMEPYQSNTVIEYRWDALTNMFVPLRTRWDKTSNPSKHGNFSAVACDIWNNIHNPIEPKVLFKFTTYKDSKDFFFEKMRKFHNKIKETLYNKYTKDCEYLLELCSGRGGDLNKWVYNNVRNVHGYDISEQNVSECQRRVAHHQSANPELTKNYKFQLADMRERHPQILSQLENKYSVVTSHFAFHYFFEKESAFSNILEVLEKSIKQNGHFILTFIDDAKLSNLFDNKEFAYKDIDSEVAYFLQKDVKTASNFFGNKLRITLNGNNILSEGSNEFIINFEDFVGIMKQKGFELVETKSFEDIYNEKSIDIPLTDVEKDISFLNRYCVFQKTSRDKDSVEEHHLPLLSTSEKFVPEADLYAFDTIDLQASNFSMYMINNSYDLINILNCLEYKYYPNMHDKMVIKTFDDIKHIFDLYSVTYNPLFVQEAWEYAGRAFTISAPSILFTYHKHTVEKKNVGDTCDNIQVYDNWYILMHKDSLVFTKYNSANQFTISKDTPTDLFEETQEKLWKLTVKELKEMLLKKGLKTSGKKEDLIQRLINK
jgi:hypothetical protein